MTGAAVYFSPAEFIVMLELVGGGPCSVLLGREELDDGALTGAFVALFRRGLICREGERLELSATGEMFRRIRGAGQAVVLSRPKRQEKLAICYVDEGGVELVEPVDAILREQYRVQRLDVEGLKSWMLDTGLLSIPALWDEDASERNEVLAQERVPPPGDVLLLLERYHNGGGLISTFEVRRWRGNRLIVRDGVEACLYTAQSLERMLADCFGKGAL